MNRYGRPSRKDILPRPCERLLAVLALLLLTSAAARAQWTGPDASGNVNTTAGVTNVGIGTSAAAAKLDVSGELKVASGRLKFTFGGPEGYIQGATERLSFWTTDGVGGQAVRMRFGGNAATSTAEFLNVSSVRLGTGVRFALGTTSPEGIFDARGGVAASGSGLPIILSAQQGASTGGAGGNVIINSGPNGPSNANGSIIFGIGGTISAGALTTGERMRITDTGLVGVGTSAPLQKFQLGTNTPTGTTTPDAISLGATYSSVAGANPKLRLYDDGAGSVYGLGSSDHQFDFMTPALTRYVWYVDGAEKMRLDSSGGLGIGKTAGAAYKLDVAGSVNASGGLCIAADCKTSWAQVGAALTVSAANVSPGQLGAGTGVGNFSFPANVGVGTSSPSAGLDVQTPVSAATANGVRLQQTLTPQVNYGVLNGLYINPTFNDGVAVGNVRNALATGAGNVGIGITATTAGLDVRNAGVISAVEGVSYGVRFQQTIPAANNYTDSTALYINPTFSDGMAVGVRHNGLVVASGNVGIGTVSPGAKLDVNAGSNTGAAISATGSISATGAITGATVSATYQDVAEWVPSTQKLRAGTVVVLDKGETNHVLASTRAYDTKVAGVVSAEPGVILGVGGEGKLKVATTGRVRVRVDATRSPIEVGDLLVTGEVEGAAMKSVEVDLGGVKIHRPGTIIGKALEPLASGTGEILVLLSLQ
jgi:hypothetical protein